jgi:hypothetical protein
MEFDLDDGPVLQAVLELRGSVELKGFPSVMVNPGEDPEPDGGRIRVCQVMVREGVLKVVKY